MLLQYFMALDHDEWSDNYACGLKPVIFDEPLSQQPVQALDHSFLLNHKAFLQSYTPWSNICFSNVKNNRKFL